MEEDLRAVLKEALEQETVVVTKYYFYHDPTRKAEARAVLRLAMDSESVRREDGMADVTIERLWNTLVGNH